jgi:rhodanese-related sulfurtransferase
MVPDSSAPLIVVRNPDQDPEEILWQARKVGYDTVLGELEGGIDSWQAAGQPTSSTAVVHPGDLSESVLLDIRQTAEFAAGHIAGAQHVELGSVATSDLPEGPLVAMCGHGERAATAASVLERAGRTDVGVLLGGPEDQASATGVPLEAAP